MEKDPGEGASELKKKNFKENQAFHSAIQEQGFVVDAKGDYPGLFSDTLLIPDSPLTPKNVKAAFRTTNHKAPFFPFPKTLKDMHHWVLAAVKARRDAETDTLPTVLAPTWTTPAKKKKPSAGSKRRRGGDIVEDAE